LIGSNGNIVICNLLTMFEIVFRYHSARYEIRVENPDGVSRGVKRVELDGSELTTTHIPIADDGATHRVRIVLGVVHETPEPEKNPTS